jgi:hypothetical protein
MNATPLFHADGRPAPIHSCAICRFAYSSADQATACCVCCSCAGPSLPGRSTCAACAASAESAHAQRIAARTARMIAAATPLLPSDTWVFRDSDGELVRLEEAIDEAEDGEAPPGTTIVFWAVRAIPLPRVSTDWVTERLCEDMHEGAAEGLIDVSGLEAFLQEWCAKQPILSYEEDESRCLVYTITGANR